MMDTQGHRRVRVEAVKVGELEDFARSLLDSRGEDDLPPIPLHRAQAHSRNPYADPDDIGLFAAFSGDRLVGYLGALPGSLRHEDRFSKVFWGSTWFVRPEFRKTLAGLLLARNFKRRLPEIVFTNISPEAWRLIYYLGARELGKCRYYLLNLKKFPLPLKKKIYDLSAGFGGPPGLTFREVNRVRETDRSKIRPFDPQAEFYRGPEVVNWMLQYPWVREEGAEEADCLPYLFSHQRKIFRQIAIEVFSDNGRSYRGFFVISVISTGAETVLKILDYDFDQPGDRSCVLPRALTYAREYRADFVHIPDEVFEALPRVSPARIFARRKERPYLYYPWTPDSPMAKAAGDLRLHYRDGDTAFT